ncbi:MAG: hypothetical protein M3O50_06940 [Myxococcota bacterium]|nr:hypothetical protein [Myxococcota bacterium]
MQLADVLATSLLVGAGAAFWSGETALARAQDLHALYWLIVGAVALRACVQIVRPGTHGNKA